MADRTVQPQFTVLGGAVIVVGLMAKPVTAWGEWLSSPPSVVYKSVCKSSLRAC